VTRGYRALDLMRAHIARTQALRPAELPGVVGGVGGFAGLFDIGGGRLLAAGADGVGTKLKLASLAARHGGVTTYGDATVGIDCVAMCVNDVACCGAQPLFFLDYIASAHTDPQRVADVVGGVADGCVQAGCALLGGETAEMPGFYAGDDYDLAGFAVGIVDTDRLWDGKTATQAGDALIGLASSGPHSNGFSLIRRVFDEEKLLGDPALLDALLTPTRIYVAALMALQGMGCCGLQPTQGAQVSPRTRNPGDHQAQAGVLRRRQPESAFRPQQPTTAETPAVHGAAHITGGGFFENIPRLLAPGLSARIDRAAWSVPAVFGEIADAGHVGEHDMFGTFNMGIGLVVAVAPGDADQAIATLRDAGAEATVIGDIVPGDGEVLL